MKNVLLPRGSLLVLAVALTAVSAAAQSPERNVRFGVGVSPLGGVKIRDYGYDYLKGSWTHAWGSHQDAAAGWEYVPQLYAYGKTAKTEEEMKVDVRGIVARRPVAMNDGTLWMVGNEPGEFWSDKRTPTEYAQVYYKAYRAIKAVNKTFRVTTGGWLAAKKHDGLTGIDYFKKVRSEYRRLYRNDMPVDVYHIHGYSKSFNPDPASVRAHIVAFRKLMKQIGEQEKPLIIKEFGPLGLDYAGVPPDLATRWRVASKDMENVVATFATLRDRSIGMPSDDYRLVQRWAWFVMSDVDDNTEKTYNNRWHAFKLFDLRSKNRTQLATTFRSLANRYYDKAYRIDAKSSGTFSIGQRVWGLRGGETLTVFGKGRTKGLAANLRLAINYIDRSGVKRDVVATSPSMRGSLTDWRELKLSWKVPSGARAVDAFFMFSGSGTVWVDDLRIYRNLRLSKGIPVFDDMARNGGFERQNVHTSSAAGIGSTPSPFWKWTNMSRYSSGVVAWSRRPGTANSMYRYKTTQNNSQAALWRWAYGWRRGDTLRLSGRARATNRGTSVILGVNYYDTSGRKRDLVVRSLPVRGGQGWRSMAVDFTVPSNARWIQVVMLCAGKGEFLLDDFVVRNSRSNNNVVHEDFEHGSGPRPGSWRQWSVNGRPTGEVAFELRAGAVRYPWQPFTADPLFK